MLAEGDGKCKEECDSLDLIPGLDVIRAVRAKGGGPTPARQAQGIP